MKYTLRQISLVPVLILAAGFSIFAQFSNAGSSGLARETWKLTEANGRAVTNTAAFIDLRAGLDKFTGNTGCNTMNGTATVKGRSIRLTRIATTKRMCKLMPGNVAEGDFLKALGDTVRFSSSDTTLSLLNRNGRVLLRFRREPANDEPTGTKPKLTGTKWALESIKGRQTFVPLPYAFVRFDEKRKSAGGDTSCNSFGGNYRVSGKDSIAVTNVIMTMRACVEDNKMTVQSEMLEGLRIANRYEIRDGRLNLYRGNRLELTFREERN